MERTVVEPMTATSSRMHVTVSREFLALLKKAKAGDSHRNPGASDEEVLTAALELLIEKQAKRKACVPAKVKREVVKRDEGKCQWKLADGGVCGATVRLEIDHVVPRGKGGPSTVENCRILCRSTTSKPRARPTATRTWTCSPVVYRAAREDVAPYGACPRAGAPSRTPVHHSRHQSLFPASGLSSGLRRGPMTNARFHVPPPQNEPILAYAPGSPERAALKAELARHGRRPRSRSR